jgi:hypothetical protein
MLRNGRPFPFAGAVANLACKEVVVVELRESCGVEFKFAEMLFRNLGTRRFSRRQILKTEPDHFERSGVGFELATAARRWKT